MYSSSPKVRLRIDWDADGAFASVTRPGEAAEEIRLSVDDTVRIMKEAAEAWLQSRKNDSSACTIASPARASCTTARYR